MFVPNFMGKGYFSAGHLGGRCATASVMKIRKQLSHLREFYIWVDDNSKQGVAFTTAVA